jgi:hypothetical protein
MTGRVDAIDEVPRRLTADIALSNHFGLFIEFDSHAGIECVERALPETLASKLLAVSDDATFDLIDLGKPSLFHQGREHLATDPTSAICDDRLRFEVIVFATLEFCDKVPGRRSIRHDRIFELTYLRFEGVPSIEEDNITSFFHQSIDLFWFEMLSAANYATLIDLHFGGATEGD